MKGISALQLGRDLNIQYESAFVLAHKLREAIGLQQMQGDLPGEVEVDGAYFGDGIKLWTGSIVHADEAGGWDALHAHYEMRRINHSVAFSLHRAEMGQHHHISGEYLISYALEMAWREDNRRQTNGALYGPLRARRLGIRCRGFGSGIGSEHLRTEA